MYKPQKKIISYYVSLMLVGNTAPLSWHDLDALDEVFTKTMQI
jgi:hypothetical protein